MALRVMLDDFILTKVGRKAIHHALFQDLGLLLLLVLPFVRGSQGGFL
jgi:hypothetical protein